LFDVFVFLQGMERKGERGSRVFQAFAGRKRGCEEVFLRHSPVVLFCWIWDETLMDRTLKPLVFSSRVACLDESFREVVLCADPALDGGFMLSSGCSLSPRSIC
jgi:hypothetical protein